MHNRTASADNIKSIINNTQEKPISKTSVRRRLAESGLHGRVAVSKLLIQAQNKYKRLLSAKKYQHFSAEESKSQLYGNSRHVYIRQRPHEKLLNEYIKSTVKHGGGNIKVWGCFSFNGVRDLHRIKKVLIKEKYHSILQRHAIPSGLRLCGRGFILQQDNDRKHTSQLCKIYLKKKD